MEGKKLPGRAILAMAAAEVRSTATPAFRPGEKDNAGAGRKESYQRRRALVVERAARGKSLCLRRRGERQRLKQTRDGGKG